MATPQTNPFTWRPWLTSADLIPTGIEDSGSGYRYFSMDPHDLAVRDVEAKRGLTFSPTLSDIARFSMPHADESGLVDTLEIPQWLLNQAKPYANGRPFAISPTGGTMGLGFQVQPGAVGDTTYKVGDTIFSASHVRGAEDVTENPTSTFNPDSFVSYANSPAYQQAMKSGQWSLLNGTPYNVLDRTGKVIGTKKFEGLEDSDNLDEIMMAVTGAGLGGMALAAAGGAGGAGAAGGTGSTLGAAGGGVTGFGDAGAMYAGLDAGAAGSLGGGASVAGGLGAAGAGTSVMGAGGAGGAGGAVGAGSSLIPGVSNQVLGAGVSALGGLLGSQGQSAESSSTKQLPGFLQGPVAGNLVPLTQGLLGTQMPAAQNAGNQLLSVGQGLLGQTAPTTATNPYLQSIADDMQRRTAELLGQNNLSIQGNAVATGGLGGSRQGVAQGIAAGKAADDLQGNLASLYGNAFNQDQNRLLQQQTLGAGLVSQGLNTPFQPLQSATSIYSPFTGFGTNTQSTSSGGGAMGAVGGALGAAQFGHNMGWW